ncbi:MAG: fatty acid cis/trans isomerase [Pseudomonadales bacterium]|nr:fatty acid cis/trans isomerase [Pseudomonadales bacterium]
MIFLRFGFVLIIWGLLSQSTFVLADETISYTRDVEPIFAHKCIACHACYDSPCQLNLSSSEGTERGASKVRIYNDPRTQPMDPTRLFIDAHTPAGWKKLGFYPVIHGSGNQPALMAKMLELGRHSHLAVNRKIPDSIVLGVDRSNSCPSTADEFDTYQHEHPQEGMPMAVAGLTDQEYSTLQTWLSQGAPVDSKPRQATAAELQEINAWETMLNKPDLRSQLVARWLYEHWFTAHLYFSDLPHSQFFEIVRSYSPPGQPIDIIATPLPNQAPDGALYYRIRPVQGILVYKTHITLALSQHRLLTTQNIFFGSPWQVAHLPGYDEASRSNPMQTFSAIPAQARYQYMLDNAEYFVRTFIRGPVCRGQLATDVIRDNFWTFFQDPHRDLYLTDAKFRAKATPLLGLPGQMDGILDLPTQWIKYRKLRNTYESLRQKTYASEEPQGAGFNDIWQGEGHNRNALLSIFRHGNSASVHRGLIGSVPQTMWLMDYPLLEQTYYTLVANYNVFGTASHQVQTRLYFDLIRYAAETNFLRLMPPNNRQPLLDDWYQDSGKIKLWLDYTPLDIQSPAADNYTSSDPKSEFATRLLTRLARINAAPDPINRCHLPVGCARSNVPSFQAHADRAFSHIAALSASQLPLIRQLPEATFIRIYTADGRQEIYSMLRNRAHSNVAFILGEDLRYQPDLDTMTIYPGILCAYPNFAFNVPARETDQFVGALQKVQTSADWQQMVKTWGVRRTSPDFWAVVNDFTQYLLDNEPVQAAVLDVNRYENL